jgi:hypothetical protein
MAQLCIQLLLEVTSMIKFMCDSCGRTKRTGQEWLLGLAAESVGVQSARREINILSAWVEPQAVHPMAVHFCSERCKDRYVSKLFSSPAVA